MFCGGPFVPQQLELSAYNLNGPNAWFPPNLAQFCLPIIQSPGLTLPAQNSNCTLLQLIIHPAPNLHFNSNRSRQRHHVGCFLLPGLLRLDAVRAWYFLPPTTGSCLRNRQITYATRLPASRDLITEASMSRSSGGRDGGPFGQSYRQRWWW